jgi:hypothetical protein
MYRVDLLSKLLFNPIKFLPSSLASLLFAHQPERYSTEKMSFANLSKSRSDGLSLDNESLRTPFDSSVWLPQIKHVVMEDGSKLSPTIYDRLRAGEGNVDWVTGTKHLVSIDEESITLEGYKASMTTLNVVYNQ